MEQEDLLKIKTKLQDALGYHYQNDELLLTALTHRSARRQNHGNDYEQLEFVGDAVLDLGIAHILLGLYADRKEGELSKMRAALVNTESLATIARELNLGELIKLSPSEETSGGADKNSILADVVEALLGAMYLEAGFDTAFEIIKKLFTAKSETVNPKDPKTELQELLHATHMPPPEYILEESAGPDHAPIFTTTVSIDGKKYGTGQGTSKKASQQKAALDTMEKLKVSAR